MKKIISLIIISIILIISSVNCYAYNMNSKVELTIEAQNLTVDITELENRDYLIQNETTGPILVNSNIVINGKSFKIINTNQNIIIDWYK